MRKWTSWLPAARIVFFAGIVFGTPPGPLFAPPGGDLLTRLARRTDLEDLSRHPLVVLDVRYATTNNFTGQNLYGETVRVPFFLALPGEGAPSRRIPNHVSTLDLVPTLRGVLGLAPGGQDQGRDLLGVLEPQPILAHLAGGAADDAFEGELRSVVVGDHRLILRPDGRSELYDVRDDPGETRDLAETEPDRVRELTARLEGAVEQAPAYPRATRIPGVASDAMLEHLSGIGYAGGDD